MAMMIGCALVSMEDQNPDLQLTALKRAGCKRIFIEEPMTARERWTVEAINTTLLADPPFGKQYPSRARGQRLALITVAEHSPCSTSCTASPVATAVRMKPCNCSIWL
jgi:hypothetical protein